MGIQMKILKFFVRSIIPRIIFSLLLSIPTMFEVLKKFLPLRKSKERKQLGSNAYQYVGVNA